MEQSIVTTKGQIVIPSKIRSRYKIKQGTRICFIERGADILLRPITDEYIDQAKGAVQTNGKATSQLLESRTKEHLK